MAKDSKQRASIPNPSLKNLDILVGEWKSVGTHPLSPGVTFHGHVTFKWLEGGAFLIMHAEAEEPGGVPSSIAIFGHDDSMEGYSMLYFDERGVSRIYEMSLSGNIWNLWRNAPGFSQRFTGTLVDQGRAILGVWEVSRDSSTWERDLELTYTRVK